MSHLLIIRSCLTSQYSFLFSVKVTAENGFVRDWWECRGFSGARVRLLQPPTTPRLGYSIQGEFIQMLPGQCQPPRPGPTRSSLPDVPGACAGPELPSCCQRVLVASVNSFVPTLLANNFVFIQPVTVFCCALHSECPTTAERIQKLGVTLATALKI